MGLDIYKSDKCRYRNEKGIEYYTIDHLQEVQKEMLRLLAIVDNICKVNGINYWLDGGTLIGALRHKGFIPWDDDIDISLAKCDYLKLIGLLEKYSDQYKDTYLFYSTKDTARHCCNFFASKKNLYARFKGILSFLPIKLDIRPVNVIPNQTEAIQENEKLRDKANYFIFHKTCLSSVQQEKIPEEEKHKFLSWYNTQYGLHVPAPDYVYSHPYYEFSKKLVLKYEDLFPVQRVKFESIEVNMPHKAEEFLKLFYGNFYEFPSLEQRAPAAYEYFSLRDNNTDLISFIQNLNKRQSKMGKILHLTTLLKLLGIRKVIYILLEKFKVL